MTAVGFLLVIAALSLKNFLLAGWKKLSLKKRM
jgi:hypothetical protein